MTSYLISIEDGSRTDMLDAAIKAGTAIHLGSAHGGRTPVTSIVKVQPQVTWRRGAQTAHIEADVPLNPEAWREPRLSGKRRIDVYPSRHYPVGTVARILYQAAEDAHDQDCDRDPPDQVTWLTMGEEKVAGVVPVEAAEEWLERETDPRAAGVTHAAGHVNVTRLAAVIEALLRTRALSPVDIGPFVPSDPGGIERWLRT